MFFDVISLPEISNKKIAILFPYREQVEQKRSEQLKSTLDYYNTLNNPDFDLYVIEQGNNKPFNRGVLLNAGHDIIKNIGKIYDNEVHHDIDVQPDKILIKYFYSNNVIAGKQKKDPYFFGTLSMLPLHIMDKVNGYCNNFWGWGKEDDNLSKRIRDNNIKIYNSDATIADMVSLPHVHAKKLGLVNDDREDVNRDDIMSGYKSGLSDLKYEIISREIVNDHLVKYIIDF
jgi:hypothetical protein